jgi:thiamine kinase-like enzyme
MDRVQSLFENEMAVLHNAVKQM